ncbi:hypothetical protein BDY24DRAFT_52261 [Mrakia frigida]|uniref:uncharacterized protein n=1 Tax=Mrakia frigida TaxID=29902 RepID=UPI003FCC2412
MLPLSRSATRTLTLTRTALSSSSRRSFSTPYLFPLVSSTKKAAARVPVGGAPTLPLPASAPADLASTTASTSTVESSTSAGGGGGGEPQQDPKNDDKDSRNIWSRSPVLRVVTRLCFSSVLGLTVLTGVLLLHDASTYGSQHVERVPVHPLAISPSKGGPKNLPILERSIEDLETGQEGMWGKSKGSSGKEDGSRMESEGGKPRLVIVGGGWGVSLFE